MQSVNACLCPGVFDFPGAYISVKHSVSKAEVILICFTAKPVNRHLIHKLSRQAELAAELSEFRYRNICQRAEITCRITVARGVADIILRQIACVGNTPV